MTLELTDDAHRYSGVDVIGVPAHEASDAEPPKVPEVLARPEVSQALFAVSAAIDNRLGEAALILDARDELDAVIPELGIGRGAIAWETLVFQWYRKLRMNGNLDGLTTDGIIRYFESVLPNAGNIQEIVSLLCEMSDEELSDGCSAFQPAIDRALKKRREHGGASLTNYK